MLVIPCCEALQMNHALHQKFYAAKYLRATWQCLHASIVLKQGDLGLVNDIGQ
jgi:hypothetical protein